MRARVRGTWRIGGLLAIAAIVPLHVAAAKPTVTAVRIGEHPSKTRFVIELSERVTFQAFTLAAPYRVVIDLPEVDWRLADDTTRTGGLITDLRYGLFSDGASRVVLDVKSPAAIVKSFRVGPSGANGHRLVIDIKPISAAEFQRRQQPRPVVGAAPGGAAVTLVRPKAKPKAKAKARRQAGATKLIVIDPGHGGVDPGATGVSGVREKTLMLAQARVLKRRLEATGRFRVVLTRSRDVFVRLRQRIAVARTAGADLFISLHADTIANPKVRGGSIYTLSERASDKEAAALAARENKADMIAGVDLAGQNADVVSILIDLAQRASMNESAIFAKILTGELSKTMRLLRRTHRFAGFAVLKSPDVPSVLIELGYLSNPVDERNLRRPRHRAQVAQAIVRAVDGYFSRRHAFNQP